MDANDVKFAWQIYLGVGAVAMLLWVLLVYKIKAFWLKLLLVLMALAFLFTPVQHPEIEGLWVPGNVAGVMRLMSEGPAEAMPILVIMGAGQGAAMLLTLLFMLLRRRWLRGRDNPAREDAGQNSQMG